MIDSPAPLRIGQDRPHRRGGSVGVSLRNEVLKARKRPAFWVLTGAMAAVAGIATVVVSEVSTDGSLPMSWTMAPRGMANIGVLCFGLAVVLLFAPEFKWRTARQSVIDGLTKESFLVGKLLFSAALALWFAAVAWAVGATVFLVLPPAGEMTSFSVADLKAWAGMGLGMAVWGSTAFFVAATARGEGAAVGIFVAYYVVEGIAAPAGASFAISRGHEFVADTISYLPGRVAEELAGNELHYGSRFPADSGAIPQTRGFAHLAGAALAYVLTFVAVSFADFRRRDL